MLTGRPDSKSFRGRPRTARPTIIIDLLIVFFFEISRPGWMGGCSSSSSSLREFVPGTELTPSCDPRVWGGGRKRPAWRRLRLNLVNDSLSLQIDGFQAHLWRKNASFVKESGENHGSRLIFFIHLAP